MSITDEQRLREARVALAQQAPISEAQQLRAAIKAALKHTSHAAYAELALALEVPQQAPTPAVLLPAAPATLTGIDYSPDQQAAARLAMMTAASMLETLPWSSELDGRKRRETAQEHQDRISMVIEKHELRRALIDELRALAEPVAEVSEPAASVDARDANVAALQECITFAEIGSIWLKPVGWHYDMIRAATKALAALAYQAAAPAEGVKT